MGCGKSQGENHCQPRSKGTYIKVGSSNMMRRAVSLSQSMIFFAPIRGLVQQAAQPLLYEHFPYTLHDDRLFRAATGFPSEFLMGDSPGLPYGPDGKAKIHPQA